LIVAAALAAAVYFWSPRANLRVTTGPPGSTAYRFITAFASVIEANHPRIQIKLVQVADLTASAKAIEDHATDLGIVRSDAVIPTNGETIAILRRDVVAFVVAAKSPIDKIPALAGKTIGIPQGPLQTYNEQTLDSILSYYNIPAAAVKRVFLPLAEIGAAVHDKHVVAVLAVGPMGPGEVVDVVGAVKLASKGAPGILAIDEADAINKRFPGLESIDVPAGAFRGRPPTPDDTVTTLAITYRFVAPNTMLDVVAGAIARSIFKTKAQLVAKTPLASQIEAPDPEERRQRRGRRHEGQEHHDVREPDPSRVELQLMPQKGSKTRIANGQHEFGHDRHVETVMNASNEYVRQDRGQETERGEHCPFGEQQQTQAVVGTPQRDPKPIELIPLHQLVESEIERQESDPGQPKLQTGQTRPAEEPGRPQRKLSLVQHRLAMNIHESLA
jgi:TRAP-type uncharacterized transport system substrate-binding protein